MSTSPGLSFANFVVILDVPQLPAIGAVAAWKNVSALLNETKWLLAGGPAGEVVYPFSRTNVQNETLNRNGRPRQYNNDKTWLFGRPF